MIAKYSISGLFNKLRERGEMIPVDILEIDKGGAVGCWDNDPLSSRQILIASESYSNELGIKAGQYRENILVRDLVVESLPGGTILKIGSCELITTYLCEPCGYMDYIRKGLKKSSIGKRGILAVVKKPGVIKITDKLEIHTYGALELNNTVQKFIYVLSAVPTAQAVTGRTLLAACSLETSYFRVLPVLLRKIRIIHPEIAPERVMTDRSVSYLTKQPISLKPWHQTKNMFL
jgi:hypothetical protein